MKYRVKYQNGFIASLSAKTEIGAKRQASKIATHGAGHITLYQGSSAIAYREFWQGKNRFGWFKWTDVV
jgi:hypothetical protein